MSRELQNPSAIGKLGTRSSPLSGDRSIRKSRSRGNAPWLKVRKRLRKPVFRNM